MGKRGGGMRGLNNFGWGIWFSSSFLVLSTVSTIVVEWVSKGPLPTSTTTILMVSFRPANAWHCLDKPHCRFYGLRRDNIMIFSFSFFSLFKYALFRFKVLDCPASQVKRRPKCDRIAPSHPLSWPCVSDLLAATSKARAATRRNPRWLDSTTQIVN